MLVLVAGCAPAPRWSGTLARDSWAWLPDPYTDTVEAVAGILRDGLGLPVPPDTRILVYATRPAYAEALVQVGGLPPDRARELAERSVALAQRRQLFLNEAVFGQLPPAGRVSVLAHELTHVAQYELSGGRRGHSEQWLREGMADWVACQVLERLGQGSLAAERDRAWHVVAGRLGPEGQMPLDLVELGHPGGWEARHRAEGEGMTYQLALLLTDELIARAGFDRLVAYFAAFARSEDRYGVFERTFGLSLARFEQEALARLRATSPPAGASAPRGPTVR